ncbi:hypothetical protein X917_gp26 [Pseudomonas phage PPpW-4]|uniref:Uncharacterized protein n=1 Tax=Pseudomonas phage PPpW-4 TaxID=1279083 RepID=V5YTI1_9CAUD|nr:hypothetical protein X917_gp26 [Pseudomonas phage PPpW-4]BAO20692.1 hypothetical protein [Pseudomonas phage PPpW-4]
MSKFCIVEALIVLAGKIQARRVARLKAKEEALKATIKYATEALIETQKERVNAYVKQVRVTGA